MHQARAPEAATKCALFVDFDNVFLCLRTIDSGSAETFARDPRGWLDWMARGMQGDEDLGSQPRRLLIRRCYLNPRTFGSYRPNFVHAGFTVVDCPPLTMQGKTSSDVYMVIDMLDVLAQLPHIEEFVLFSADADFTPVLHRIRAHDKQSLALTVGPVSSAYTAACDRVIHEETFIEFALQSRNWSIRPGRESAAAPADNDEGLGTQNAELRARIVETVRDLVADSSEPIPMATAAQVVQQELGQRVLDTKWAGAYSFRSVLEESPDPSFEVLALPVPGYLLDPRRHIRPTVFQPYRLDGISLEMREFVQRVNRFAQAPMLKPADYAAVFKAIVGYVDAHGFNLTQASKAVRDILADRNIPRSAIACVLKGIGYSGHRFAPGDRPSVLAAAFRANLSKQLELAGVEFGDAERDMLNKWILAESSEDDSD
ncbi:MAG: NYN domain-containing protein [Bryobacterales bacterium]|nr:NYN domain-containing protein [Bryobacterales bacterium]